MADMDEIERPTPASTPDKRDWAGALGSPTAAADPEVGFMGSALYEKGKTSTTSGSTGHFGGSSGW